MISADGKLYPGVFIFPRAKLCDEMVVPHGWLASANKSGYMDEPSFLKLLKHLRNQITCCPERPVLMLVDGHSSHVGYSIAMYCKQEGIILQTLPPHTSHASQPLDRGVYSAFKRYLKEGHEDWIRNHPGQAIKIYDVPIISEPAIKKAFSSNNIIKDFKATGIYPFSRTAIPGSMYSLAIPTDLPGEKVTSNIIFVFYSNFFFFIL